jgi:D-alanyl-lipoteichoic acid acyltransferase DltB (MBOAT superfamily)
MPPMPFNLVVTRPPIRALMTEHATAAALNSATDPSLLLALGVALAATLLMALTPRALRRAAVPCLSVLSALACFRRAFVGFVVVAVLAYLLLRYLNTYTDLGRRWHCACALLFLLALVFGAGRLLHWDRATMSVHSVPFAMYSLDMWMLLRLVTLFWEVGSGTIAAPSPLRYIIWICLPFTLAGPLMRFSEMPGEICPNRALWKTAYWWMEIAAGSGTLVLGFALELSQQALTTHWPASVPHGHFVRNAIGTFITGPLSFYLTLAGYYRCMQALALPAGFKLKPSFNFPIGRENISAFWMNWNMTATFVFRDYLFYNRWGRANYNIYFNTILLFTLVGFWHAANTYWILWGFLHGLLFSTFLLWRKYGKKTPGLPLRGTPASRTAARALTYFAVCMAWYLPSKIIQKLHGIAF